MSLSTVWDWKVEPDSPGFVDVDPSEDVWLFDDNDVVEQVTVVTEEDEKLGQPATRAEVAARLLDDLDEWIKEEPFNDWLEEKIDLPIFEDLPPLLDQRTKYKSLDTQTLLQEFETVFGEVEFNNGALTPPQSPPLPYPSDDVPAFHQLGVLSNESQARYPVQTDLLLGKVSNESQACYPVQTEDLLLGKVTYSVGSEGQVVLLQTLKSYREEETVLDELVRSRAADIDTSCDPWDATSSSDSPRGSSESDFVLSPPESGSESSNACFADPEWVPAVPGPSGSRRKRGKPYARPVEDKRLRKKEQNKNAATRYRQKKKAEVDVILDEEKGLMDRNTELHKDVDELAREIKYLKGLMRDLFKAKGLLK